MFWGSKTQDYAMDDTIKTADFEPLVKSDDGYTVGVDDDGKTVMRVSCRGVVNTITMTENGVRQMIRLLEATLPHDEEEA